MFQHSKLSSPGLGAWSFYFLIKIALVTQGLIELSVFSNIVLFFFLIVPIHLPWLRIPRQIIAVFVATALLYSETNLPPIERLTAQWELISAFSAPYLFELLTRIISLQWAVALLISWGLYMYLAKRLSMTPITFVALLSVPFWSSVAVSHTPVSVAGNQLLEQYYQEQAGIKLTPQASTAPNFDILILNICSLSWSDLKAFDLLEHPFMSRADIMLTNFYSNSSYSGPAALRLLQASCGHRPHSEIFNPIRSCTLASQLSEHGFSSEIRMNHTGAFDNFLTEIRQLGGLQNAAVIEPSQFPVAMEGFDKSPIYDDNAVLNNWLQTSTEQPLFTFYNTTTLHDGNQMKGFIGNSRGSYKQRLEKLLNDFNKLFDDIEDSGRAVLVVMVPEHGAGLEGDRFQLPGMREIPTPALTHVPVMIKLFGPGLSQKKNSQGNTLQVSHTTSPLAITDAIYKIIAQQPFSGGQYQPENVANSLLESRPVAENEGVVMMEANGEFYLKINRDNWRPYKG
ncbi:MAG TPA: cellulose biosynthesis protein BcsG [Aliidiomarina sp.]|nr:cellulose biosynthesis protein BcsG [Aliidiomarina sp.]